MQPQDARRRTLRERAYGLLGRLPETTQTALSPLLGGPQGVGILDFLPGSGQAFAADDYTTARMTGDRLGQGIAALGAIPVVGAAGRGARVASKGARTARAGFRPVPRADSETMRAYGSKVEDVPIDFLLDMRGNNLRHGDAYIDELMASIAATGLEEPVIISVGKASRTAMLGEGNHRVEAARRAGFTHIPARVVVGSEWGAGEYPPRNDLVPRAGEYFPADAAPSTVFTGIQPPRRQEPPRKQRLDDMQQQLRRMGY